MITTRTRRPHADRAVPTPAAPRLRPRQARVAKWIGFSVAVLGAAAVVNALRAQAAEKRYPPRGSFVAVDGVRVHYTEHGDSDAPPIVLIHGNFSMVQDWELSDVLDQLRQTHRVIVFDRPGYGYSERPTGTKWTAQAQAAQFVAAAAQLGVERPVVVGHSWGTLPALAWALDHPERIGGLVLLSGYYYPTTRPDVISQKPLTLPVIGDIVRWTAAPIQLRVFQRLGERQIFGPSPTNTYFTRNFPWELAARPSQVRATFADTAQMTDAAASLAPRYGELTLPIAIVHGTGDRLVGVEAHAERLASELPHARLVVIEGAGHMVQHIAPGIVSEAIEAVAAQVASEAAATPQDRVFA